MDRLKLTSPGLLLIVAVLAAGGIFLLDACYLRPQSLEQQEAAIRDQAVRSENYARSSLCADDDALGRFCQTFSARPPVREALTSRQSSLVELGPWTEMARFSQADLIWIAAPDNNVVAAWQTQADGTLTQCPANVLRQLSLTAVAAAEAKGGHLKLPSTLAHFVRHDVWSDGPGPREVGHLFLARTIKPCEMERVESAIGGQFVFVLAEALPASQIADSPSHSIWTSAGRDLSVAWPVTDVGGNMLGYFRATMPLSMVNMQAAAGRRTVLIVLSLSVGLSLLVIMGAHILVTGPVVRLLRRLQRLESGQGSAKDLSRDLHGEPLLLARRLESAFDRLALISKTDQLTGLANRRHFEQVLDCFYNQARRYNRPLSLIVLDVDFFKAVNDTGGHQAGDRVLQSVARAIETACRRADLPARFGGDEFAVLLPETASADAQSVCERIAQTVAELNIQVRGMGLKISLSAGVADLNSGEMDCPSAMMALADRALYTAKELGRNRIIQAHDLPGLAWETSDETSGKVSMMSKKLAGLDSQFKDLFLMAIEEMVGILEHRSPHMADHAHKVQRYAVLIAKEMELSERVIKRIQIAAMLHDIGMIAMPDTVLLNPNVLDEQQAMVMRNHPLLSVRIMEGMEFLEQEIPAVRYHHERFDGKGYPEGIAGSAIPLTARILSVADAFDAMTTSRAHRQAKTRDEALVEMKAGAGSQFDPAVVDALLSVAAKMGDTLMDEPTRTRRITDLKLLMNEMKDFKPTVVDTAVADAAAQPKAATSKK